MATKKTTKKTTKKKRKKRKSSAEVAKDLWIKGIANSSTDESRSYSVKNNYEVGEIIDHKSFGRGVVKCLVGNEKIEVVFEDVVKTLVQNK